MLQQKESYDVLRLIEHGQLCYISSENVQGKTLDRYLKYHPVIKKREIFLLLKEIVLSGLKMEEFIFWICSRKQTEAR